VQYILSKRKDFYKHLPFPAQDRKVLRLYELLKQFGIKEYIQWCSNETKVDKINGWIKAIPEWESNE